MLPNQKVSIVIPNYKDDKYLENTLKSLLSQTYKNIEIVLICDEPSEEKENALLKIFSKALGSSDIFIEIRTVPPIMKNAPIIGTSIPSR